MSNEQITTTKQNNNKTKQTNKQKQNKNKQKTAKQTNEKQQTDKTNKQKTEEEKTSSSSQRFLAKFIQLYIKTVFSLRDIFFWYPSFLSLVPFAFLTFSEPVGEA